MTLKKNYFSVIFSSLMMILFFIILFYIQNFYIQKYHTLERSVSQKQDTKNVNDDLNKMDKYYQKEIENLNNNKNATIDALVNLERKRVSTINNVLHNYEELDTLNKVTIHKFVANMLRYNPYLLEQQIIDEIAQYFDISYIPLKISTQENNLLLNEEIIIQNNITKSSLNDGRELNIVFKSRNSFNFSQKNDIKIKKIQIKSYPMSDNVKITRDMKIEKLEKFITFDNLIFIISVICIVMLFRIVIIMRYNIKINKIFLKPIKEELLIKENYFTKNKTVLEIIEKYNKLLSIRGDIIKESSSLEKRHEQFIADSIHQLKTPLSVIMINLDLIEMSIDTKEISDIISQIKTSIDMLTLTYEELSYLSMNNSLEYKSTYLNLSEIIQRRLDFFKQIAINNDKKIESTVLSNLYSTINKIEFERIIDNNLINAIKYSKSHSIIGVSFVKVDEINYKLTISSYGNEIKNSTNIFKRHYREEEGKRGHGLGLAITKEICDKYDIEIKYTREEGKNIFQYVIYVT